MTGNLRTGSSPALRSARRTFNGLKATVRRWYRGLPPITAEVVAGIAVVNIVLLVLRLALPEAFDAAKEQMILVPALAWQQPWTLVTMALFHDDFLMLLLNVMAFASLGSWVERSLGRRRFPLLMITSVLAGSLLHVIVGWPLGFTRPAFGSSGLVLGVMTAFSLLYPEAELRFWFAAPLKARNLVWLIVGIDLIMLIAGMSGDVLVHAGAMISAWAFLRKPWRASYRQRVIQWTHRVRGRR